MDEFLKKIPIGLAMLLCSLIICMGVIRLVVSYVIGKKDKAVRQKAIAFVVFSVSGGCYTFACLGHWYFPFFIGNGSWYKLVETGLTYFFLIAGCVNFYVNLEEKRFKRVMQVFLDGMAVLGICVLIAHITISYSPHRLQMVVRAAGNTGMLAGMIGLWYEWMKNHRRDTILAILTLFPILTGVSVESANYYISLLPYQTASTVGIFLTAVLQFVLLHEVLKRQEEEIAYQKQIEKELAQSKISIMLSQIQPHFLYNALNTIQYLCETDPMKASAAVGDFSDYLRANMDSLSQKDTIPFTREFLHLNNYLGIEQLRFPDVCVEFDLQCTNFKLPALTLQPLVENAIRYGVTRTDSGQGTVKVSTWEDEHAWYMQVEDDGVGYDPRQTQHDGRSHIGINNTKNRLYAMCQGMLEIKSSIGEGTTVKISIPKEGEITCGL